jgi:hypothetical protein
MWNITISMVGPKCMCLDVNNFYLDTPMDSFNYLHIPVKLIPQEIISEYKILPALVTHGHVYSEVQKGMHGLPQAVKKANQFMAPRLAVNGYHHTKFTPAIWKHDSRLIKFTLGVDEFGVQYVGVNMPITSLILWSSPIPFLKIGREVYIVALQ